MNGRVRGEGKDGGPEIFASLRFGKCKVKVQKWLFLNFLSSASSATRREDELRRRDVLSLFVLFLGKNTFQIYEDKQSFPSVSEFSAV